LTINNASAATVTGCPSQANVLPRTVFTVDTLSAHGHAKIPGTKPFRYQRLRATPP
jgi:hypothetical protein